MPAPAKEAEFAQEHVVVSRKASQDLDASRNRGPLRIGMIAGERGRTRREAQQISSLPTAATPGRPDELRADGEPEVSTVAVTQSSQILVDLSSSSVQACGGPQGIALGWLCAFAFPILADVAHHQRRGPVTLEDSKADKPSGKGIP